MRWPARRRPALPQKQQQGHEHHDAEHHREDHPEHGELVAAPEPTFEPSLVVDVGHGAQPRPRGLAFDVFPPAYAPRACSGCGCTDLSACVTEAGPCSWISEDRCSACGPITLTTADLDQRDSPFAMLWRYLAPIAARNTAAIEEQVRQVIAKAGGSAAPSPVAEPPEYLPLASLTVADLNAIEPPDRYADYVIRETRALQAIEAAIEAGRDGTAASTTAAGVLAHVMAALGVDELRAVERRAPVVVSRCAITHAGSPCAGPCEYADGDPPH